MRSLFLLDERRRDFVGAGLACTGGLALLAVAVVALAPADSRVFSSAANQKSSAEPY